VLCACIPSPCSTNAAHRVEDYKLELQNDIDLNVLFARRTLLEHQPLTKFPEAWHEFPNGSGLFDKGCPRNNKSFSSK
jgi:hypothetical protein